MGFTSAKEAFLFLGLTEKAGREQVKSAYKERIKAYHPDSNPDGETSWLYYDTQAAYEYLMEYFDGIDRLATATVKSSAPKNIYQPSNQVNVAHKSAATPNIFGAKSDLSDLAFKQKVRAEHIKQERRSKERAKKEKEDREKALDQYMKDKAYEEAMTKIHANRAAELTAQIIEAYLKGEKK